MSASDRGAAFAIAFGAATAASSGGCAPDPVQRVDVQLDCVDDCNRYRDCYDVDYDTVTCGHRCEDLVAHDPSWANECDSCLHTHACTTATFACSAECNGVIP